ncbi:unnamed protein product [Ilex paraguariensis]|uniref:Uncharacterized protein n=1 Tax=Ilex paraguariensis TaxID=185542 RepID=A0ABC8USU1_9AQUA
MRHMYVEFLIFWFSDEAEKWEKITYAGIATCTVYTIYNLYKGNLTHPRYYEEPPKSYRIHKKDFPWGPDPLIEHIKEEEVKKHR